MIWGPQPGPQNAMLQCPIQDLFFGGSRGGGKTDGLIGDFVSHAGKYGEYARGILFRRTYPEMEEVERRCREVLGRLGWTYHETKRTWTAPNKATLRLRYLDKNKDANNYQGHQYTWMGFDELGNFPSPEPVDKLWACLRSAHGVPCVRRSTGNPGGPGHAWVKQRYIEPHRPGFRPFRYTPIEDRPDLSIEAVFIPSKLDDNLLLQMNDPGYEARLASAGGPALFKAWRHGDWDAVVGAAFGEWRSDLHIASHEPPKHGVWTAGGDYGSPGGIWTVFSDSERELVRLEYYFHKTDPYTVGRTWAAQIQKHGIWVRWLTMDAYGVPEGYPDIREEISRGISDELGEGAAVPPVLPVPKGKGSRHTKKQLLYDMLRVPEWVGPEDKRPPWAFPRMQIHPSCKNLIRTLPALPLDPDDPLDVDTEAEDHPYDGITGRLMNRVPKVERHQKKVRDPDEYHVIKPKPSRPWENDVPMGERATWTRVPEEIR